MRTPVVLITGIDPSPMAAVAIGLQWDLPNAVVIRHEIDPHRQVLTRTVSDVSGVLEREEIHLEHACVTCAIREDIVPTIERCARDGRWKSVIAHLPVGAEADPVCAVVHHDTRMARHFRIASTVCALDGAGIAHDLLGDTLLREVDRHSAEDDTRGMGEVGCAQVEFADLVVLTGRVDPRGRDLVRTLARPDAVLVEGAENLSCTLATQGLHDHEKATAWISPTFDAALSAPASEAVWRLDLRSPHAFHPTRLLLAAVAAGPGAGLGRRGWPAQHRCRPALGTPCALHADRPHRCRHGSRGARRRLRGHAARPRPGGSQLGRRRGRLRALARRDPRHRLTAGMNDH